MGEAEAARQNYLWGVWCVHAFQIKKCNFQCLIPALTQPLIPYTYIKRTLL